MEIKLIATDLDGTFLYDDKTVPEENLKAFAECAARGIEVVPATGRIIRGIPEELRNLPGVRYIIATNGAIIIDLLENKEISACRIKNDLAVRVMELAKAFGCTDMQLGVYPQNDDAVAFYQKCGFTIRSIEMQKII